MSSATRRRRLLLAVVLFLVCAAAVAVGGLLVRPVAGTGDGSAGALPGAPSSAPPGAPSAGSPGTPVADPSPSTEAPSSEAPSTEAPSTEAPAAGPSSATTTPAPQPEPVALALTYSGWDPAARAIVAGGLVPDRVESGGVCTLTLSRDEVVLLGETEAVPDATATSCGELRIADERLSSGWWQAVLRYTSPTSTGESQVREVMVP